MSRFYTYLNTAVKVVHQYKGEVPLHLWLKDFFRQRKQMGSKDRKLVSDLVYGYYRTGHALPAYPAEEKLLAGQFFCHHTPQEILQYLKPLWNEAIGLPLEEKQALLQVQQPDFSPNNIFPWKEELSAGVDPLLFNQSFLQQPHLFIRIRPGHEQPVAEKLKAAGVSYHYCSPSCISVPNTTKIDQLLELDREAVIQDYNSQQTGQYFFNPALGGAPQVWDCCAASGGKSLMAYDLNPHIQLTVSDIRTSILHNLRQRFERAGIPSFQSLLTDLSLTHARLPTTDADLIIADVPCSGSGTWSRTPEQLLFFDPEKNLTYQELQKKIVTTAVKKLKKGGRLVYITCSVFKKENEEMVQFIEAELGLKIESAALLKGFGMRADTMFVGVLS